MKPQRRTLMLLLLLLTPLILGLCLFMGASGIGLPDWHTDPGRSVLMLRINRVLAGFIIGAGLSCAGVVFQAILKNPLAEPYILGVSSGAGLGAALSILTGLGSISVMTVPFAGFLFAITTLIIVYLVSSRDGTPSVYGLILSGVIVSSVCSSILMFLVATAPVEGLHGVLWWLLGNLEVPSVGLLIACASLVTAGCAAVWMLSPELNALTLGSEMAHHVGVRTKFVVLLGLSLATLITAAAVGLAGLIGFVGLIVPHVTRSVFGSDHRRLIPAAALAGGLFLALCDAVARTAMAPIEIPVGVVTALLGGPFFLMILRRRRKRGSIE